MGAAAQEENKDPFEAVNRKIFAFNEALDGYFLRPVAKGYRFVTPDPMERGVSNFVFNILEFNTVINSALQGRAQDTVHSTGRLLINSTLGLGGLFDVATRIGLEPRTADFGQTLYTWGLGEGPFLMVPVLGPRTMRSGVGTVFDTYTSLPFLSGEGELSFGFTGVETIDIRAQLLKADELLSGDRYIFLRESYRQSREYFVTGGEIDDSFSDFEDEEDYEEF
ncbi:MAG: VacJ family lipoprotein [Halioglobus sp.]|nr:VacJ family lipoprotein [Halioglobus sp.]